MRYKHLLLIASLTASLAGAQDIVSARAGLIHYMEGSVMINGQSVEQHGDAFNSMKQGETLSTERGRAEILLNAGTYLRIGEASAFKLESAALDNTLLTLLSGTVLIEVAELPKDTSAAIRILGTQVSLKKRGLYEFSADAPGNVRVYDGELAMTSAGALPIKIGKGREIAFNALASGPGKFDLTATSSLYNWGSRRAIYIAQANQDAARSAYSTNGRNSASILASSMGYPGYGGVWVYSSFYGMYTYLPLRGYGYSPYYGIRIFSPQAIYSYSVGPVQGVNLGSSDNSVQRSSVTSTAYSSSAAVSNSSGAVAVPAAAAPAVVTTNTGGGGDDGRRR